MIILNIETSTNVCSAALTDGAEVIDYRQSRDGNHAHNLPLFVESLLETAKQKDLKIEAVSVSAGPGSYTGLRIGVATAKGLCYGLGVPLIAIDTLRALCASLISSNTKIPNDALLCPMIDARRMEVYCALYKGLERATEVEAKVIDEVSFKDAFDKRQVVFFGNGAEKCKAVIESQNAVFIGEIVPDARQMGVLAEEQLRAGDTADIAYFAPFYLKEFHATVSHKAQDVLNQTKANN